MALREGSSVLGVTLLDVCHAIGWRCSRSSPHGEVISTKNEDPAVFSTLLTLICQLPIEGECFEGWLIAHSCGEIAGLNCAMLDMVHLVEPETICVAHCCFAHWQWGCRRLSLS
jgi:hypothetical protein